MHQADREPKPAARNSSSLREIPDPDAAAQAPEGPPPNVLIVKENTSRGISPRAAVALLMLFVALGGLAARGLVSDWEGLLTETQERWSSHENAPAPPVLASQTPESPAPPKVAEEPNKAPNPEPAPIPDNLLAAAPIPPQPPQPPRLPPAKPEATPADKLEAETETAKPAPRADDTRAALADIEKEVERKRKEREELAKLRKQAERDAPPPAQPDPRIRRFGFGAMPMPMPINPRDRDQLARMIREQQLRQIQEMERIFDEMERAQANGPRGWPPMMPRLPRPNFNRMIPPAPNGGNGARPFVPDPPEPGLPDFAPPPAWPGLNNNRQPEVPRPPRPDNRA